MLEGLEGQKGTRRQTPEGQTGRLSASCYLPWRPALLPGAGFAGSLFERSGDAAPARAEVPARILYCGMRMYIQEGLLPPRLPEAAAASAPLLTWQQSPRPQLLEQDAGRSLYSCFCPPSSASCWESLIGSHQSRELAMQFAGCVAQCTEQTTDVGL